MFRYKKGFTLVEIMVVLSIAAILFTGLYMSVQPYMKRSRDTKRVTSIQQYTSILEAYEKDFETFPSNYGSGGSPVSLGYCLSELGTRGQVGTNRDMQFQALNNGIAKIPVDPISSRPPIGPCAQAGSFFYSRMRYGVANEVAIMGANLETRSSANYGTGSDLSQLPNPDVLASNAKINAIIGAQKSTIPATAVDQIFIVSRLR